MPKQLSTLDLSGNLTIAGSSGTSGQVLASAGSGNTPAWTTLSSTYNYDHAGKNALINGNFDIWQRGTSFTISSNSTGYTADRWQIASGASASTTVTRESTIVPANSTYSIKVSTPGNDQAILNQNIETANAIKYAGQTVTVTAKVAASASIPLTLRLNYSTTADDLNFGTVISPSSGGSATPTSSTFITITGTFAVPATAKTLRVTLTPTSTTSGAFYAAQVQLELGSVASPFSRAAGNIQAELAACQRYYYKLIPGTAFGLHTMAQAFTSTSAFAAFTTPVTMRVAPSLSASGLGAVGGAAISAVAYYNATPTGTMNPLPLQFTSSAMTNGNPIMVRNNNDATGYLAFDAEI